MIKPHSAQNINHSCSIQQMHLTSHMTPSIKEKRGFVLSLNPIALKIVELTDQKIWTTFPFEVYIEPNWPTR